MGAGGEGLGRDRRLIRATRSFRRRCDESAANLVEFLHELTEAIEHHYFAQLRRYYSPADIAQRDLQPAPAPTASSF